MFSLYRKYGFTINILTNGTPLTKKKVDIIKKNIDGYDNRNITEEDNLHKIIRYNEINSMLKFLLSNRSDIEKVLFIESNDILKKNNIFNEDFDFFKKDEDF
jgi:hypothetical protein